MRYLGSVRWKVRKKTVWKKTRPGVSSCPPGCNRSPHNSKVSIEKNYMVITLSGCLTILAVKIWKKLNFDLTRPGVSSCPPPGCKRSPHNSKVSIEQNFASSKILAVVKTIKL